MVCVVLRKRACKDFSVQANVFVPQIKTNGLTYLAHDRLDDTINNV